MMKKCGGHYEAPPRAGWSEDQLVSGELIELGGLTASLAIRTGGLRGVTHDLAIGLHVVVDQPVIGTEGGAGLLDGERLAWELEVLEHGDDLGFAEAAGGSRRGGSCGRRSSAGRDRLGGLIRGLRGLRSRGDRVLSIAVVGIHSE